MDNWIKSGYGIYKTIDQMSGNTNSSNYHAGCRKKQNKKRQATSPLSENSSPDLNTKEKSNNNSGQKKGYPFGQYQQTMGFQPGFGPMSQPMSQPSYIQTSPSAQYNGSAFSALQPTTAPPPAPPPWATELLEEVKQIKTKLQNKISKCDNKSTVLHSMEMSIRMLANLNKRLTTATNAFLTIRMACKWLQICCEWLQICCEYAFLTNFRSMFLIFVAPQNRAECL